MMPCVKFNKIINVLNALFLFQTIYGQLGYSFFGGVLALDQIRLTDGSC